MHSSNKYICLQKLKNSKTIAKKNKVDMKTLLLTKKEYKKQMCQKIQEKYEFLFFSKNTNYSVLKHIKSVSDQFNFLLNNQKFFNQIEKKQIEITPQKNDKKKTLFLDLDETLIHCCSEGKNSVLIQDSNNKLMKINFNVRPYCKEFLQNMSKLFEIYIYTAAKEDYTQAITSFLDPNCDLIDGILNRNCCLQVNKGMFIKDLNNIRNRNIKDMILVDNNFVSFGSSYENGIPIISFLDNEEDKELFYLEDYLKSLINCEDVREINKIRFKMDKFSQINIENKI